MGLNIEISLDKDIRELDQFMTDLKFKVITKSARQALNRTATDTKSNAIIQIQKRRAIKKKDAKGFVNTSRAKGMDLFKLEARVNFSGVPLPMILFILGTKTPRRQLQKNSRRKSRKFEVVKGRKSAKKGLFIQKAKSGKRQYQVFRRADPNDKTKGFKMQSAPSIAEFLRNKQNIMRKIENHAIDKLQLNYDNVLVHNLKTLRL